MAQTSEKRSGRLERRRLQASTRLADFSDWPGLAQVCRLVRTTRQSGVETVEIDYAITSVPRGQGDAAQLLSWWRGHWGIENCLHYVRDVTFSEDACQISKGHAPQNLATLRNAIISMLRMDGHTNIAAAIRKCCWNTQYMLAKLGIVKK